MVFFVYISSSEDIGQRMRFDQQKEFLVLIFMVLGFCTIILGSFAGNEYVFDFAFSLLISGILAVLIAWVQPSSCVRASRTGEFLFALLFTAFFVVNIFTFSKEITLLQKFHALMDCSALIPPDLENYECDCTCHRLGYDGACEKRLSFCLKGEGVRGLVFIGVGLGTVLTTSLFIVAVLYCYWWGKEITQRIFQTSY